MPGHESSVLTKHGYVIERASYLAQVLAHHSTPPAVAAELRLAERTAITEHWHQFKGGLTTLEGSRVFLVHGVPVAAALLCLREQAHEWQLLGVVAVEPP